MISARWVVEVGVEGGAAEERWDVLPERAGGRTNKKKKKKKSGAGAGAGGSGVGGLWRTRRSLL